MNTTSIEILRHGRLKLEAEYRAKLDELDGDIAILEAVVHEETTPRDGHETAISSAVRPGQYRGWSFAGAVEDYLGRTPSQDIPTAQVVADLRLGGAMVGKRKGKQQRQPETRDVRILGNNKKGVFKVDPVKETIRRINAPIEERGLTKC